MHQSRAGLAHDRTPAGLSERDVVVLDLLARNVSRRDIAGRLDCSTTTLDRVVGGLRERYAVETTIEVVVRAVRDGVI